MLLIIGAAVIFYHNQISYQQTQSYLDRALNNVFRQNLLVSLLLNIRSMVNIANKLEPF